MRSIKLLALSASLALFISAPLLARESHKDAGSFVLSQSVRVGSTVLKPGHYKAEWVGPNGDVQVSIIRDGKTVATTRGEIKELSEPSPYTAVTLKTTNDHSKSMEEIDFGSRREALVLTNALS